ncbi:cytochrome P450 [Mycena pura]|uniref:Cytochrome P450 n=1 Tax=Mycena pura TaxID=153505 RepID=A0AAD6V4H3_9AGAR|nr:cytochrome P450 [Mycena pura]
MAASYFPSDGVWGSLKTSPATIALLSVLAVIGLLSARSKRTDSSKIYDLGGFPMLSAWFFFSQRYDFMCSTFKRTGQKMFRFRVLQHHVVALSGDEGRKVFFTEKNFNMAEGYRILGGPVPRPQDINIRTVEESSRLFVRHVLGLFRKDRLMDVMPHLLEDINRRMDNWGKSGKVDPFKEMHNLVFQMTVRMGTCRELADNPQATARLSELFLLHEESASPISLLLPWLPGRAKQTKEKATQGLFDIVSHYVDLRRKATAQSSDAIDRLIADGYDDATTITYTLGIVFVGVGNTGTTICWILIFLGDKPKWKAKVANEVRALLRGQSNSSDPVHRRFASVPLHAWEEEMPVLDAVLKETMRLTMSGTVLRRNIGCDTFIGHKKIHDSDFVAYSLGDIHLDSDVYPDPLSFDPARFLEEREETNKVSFPFVGWGAGRHPCAGMRAAKLEIKLAIALFFSKFEYDIVDVSGKLPKSLPQPDKNNIQSAKPLPGDTCYLKYERMDNF